MSFGVKVKTLRQSEFFVEGLSAETTVLQLKERVEASQGIPRAKQRLIFRGKVLKDDQTLESYKIEQGCSLNLVERKEEDAAPSSSSASAAAPASSGARPAAPMDFGGSGLMLGASFDISEGGPLPDFNAMISSVLDSLRNPPPASSDSTPGTGPTSVFQIGVPGRRPPALAEIQRLLAVAMNSLNVRPGDEVPQPAPEEEKKESVAELLNTFGLMSRGTSRTLGLLDSLRERLSTTSLTDDEQASLTLDMKSLGRSLILLSRALSSLGNLLEVSEVRCSPGGVETRPSSAPPGPDPISGILNAMSSVMRPPGTSASSSAGSSSSTPRPSAPSNSPSGTSSGHSSGSVTASALAGTPVSRPDFENAFNAVTSRGALSMSELMASRSVRPTEPGLTSFVTVVFRLLSLPELMMQLAGGNLSVLDSKLASIRSAFVEFILENDESPDAVDAAIDLYASSLATAAASSEILGGLASNLRPEASILDSSLTVVSSGLKSIFQVILDCNNHTEDPSWFSSNLTHVVKKLCADWTQALTQCFSDGTTSSYELIRALVGSKLSHLSPELDIFSGLGSEVISNAVISCHRNSSFSSVSSVSSSSVTRKGLSVHEEKEIFNTIAMDEKRQATMSRQRPPSDAYLAGSTSKKRRTGSFDSAAADGSVDLSASIRRQVATASEQASLTIPPDHPVMDDLAELTRLYEQMLLEDLHKRVREDPDFESGRFPFSSKVLGKK